MALIDAARKIFDQKLKRFILVGLFNTALSMTMMFGLYRFFRLGYWGSSALTFFLCSIVSYFLNRRYTFGSRAGYFRSGLRFALNIGVCYGVAYLAAKPLIRTFLKMIGSQIQAGLSEQLAMLAGMVLFTGMNYLGQRFFVFPENDRERSGMQ